jgi:hypothetical protein
VAVAPEERDHVRIVALVAVQVHHQRRIAVHPERAGGEHRTLDAVRAALADHLARRQHRLAAHLVVDRRGVQPCLDLLGRGEAAQHRELTGRESQVRAAGSSGPGGGGLPGQVETVALLGVAGSCAHGCLFVGGAG